MGHKNALECLAVFPPDLPQIGESMKPEYVPEEDGALPVRPPAPHGRGAVKNPPNRFVPLEIEADPEEGPPGPIPTRFFLDRTRTVITTNNSPDVGIEASINPYRGCEHGCVYCLAGDTHILMGDGSQQVIADLKVGDEIYGTVRDGFYRRYVKSQVLAHWTTVKRAYRVVLEDGTELTASGDHRFLTDRGWKHVTPRLGMSRPHLTCDNKLMGIGPISGGLPYEKTEKYRRGYLCGMIRGDGHVGSYYYDRPGRSNGDQHRFRLALVDQEALDRSQNYLLDFEIPTDSFIFQEENDRNRLIRAIRTSSRALVDRIRGLIEWPNVQSIDWNRGFLAGLFDAEGSLSQGVLRICNTDQAIISHADQALLQFGFDRALELRKPDGCRPISVLRIRGGFAAHLRFIQMVDPAILRKRSVWGQAVKSAARLRVASVEPLGRSMRLFDITTSTGDFIANGVISHNCYARPTHEYLGLSSGIDFETQIWVKENAPELLVKELSSPKYEPRVLALSGITDPYQPVEKRLKLTRRILEVLVQFKNPVAIITKNHLVTRDADLLAELAKLNAAVVYLSITTLNDALRNKLEPRTSSPLRRLEAIRTLTEQGIPAGVMMAPIIPGLTDSEIPALLKAAADAGAIGAGYTMLRLPYQVAPLFEAWLAAHYPDRKDKILNRVRSIRGGKLNDPRFGSRMRGEGFFADEVEALFRLSRRRAGLGKRRLELTTAHFRVPGISQGDLFSEP